MSHNLPNNDSSTYEGFDTTLFLEAFEICDCLEVWELGYNMKSGG